MADDDVFSQILARSLNSGSNITGTGASDLNAFNQTIQGTNPFGIASRSLTSWNPNMSTWNAPTSGLVSFGKSFLAGLLGNMARNDAAEQLSKVAAVFPQLENHPESVAVPEGVDSDAFNTLKLSQMLKKQAVESAIRERLATTLGMNYDPLEGTVSPIEGKEGKDLSTMMTEISQAKKSKSALASKAQVSVASELGKEIAAVAALNDAKKDISNFAGARTFGTDSTIGGIIDWLGKQIPGTNAYQFQKDMPSLIDPVTQGLTGGKGTIASLAQTKQMFGQDFGQPADSMLTTQDKTAGVFADKIAANIAALEAAGWPEVGEPVDANGNRVPNLTEIKQRFEALKAGAGLNELGVSPKQDLSSSSFDINAAKEEAALMRSMGIAPSEIAQALRAKYGSASGG